VALVHRFSERTRHLVSRSRIASLNDREMDVIVAVNVFYSDSQVRWIRGDITVASQNRASVHNLPFVENDVNRRLFYHRRLMAESG